jgi:DNA-binding MarR family transcriptional regulator
MTTLHSLATEALQPTIERFWETIPPVWTQIRENVRLIALENYAISVEQFHILRHVRQGMRSASDLASARRISRPAISQSVDALVEKGLLTRDRSAADRRCVDLDLTPRGADLLAAIFDANRAWMVAKLAALDPAEVHDLLLGLSALKKAFMD